MSEDANAYSWISVDELVRRTSGGVSRTLVYEWAKQQKIPAIREGRKVLVRSDALDVLYARRQS